jgi:transposase-like protein
MILAVEAEMRKKQRRTYDAAFKLDTVMEGVRGEKSIAQICREKGIKDSLYYKWRDQFLARATEIFEDQRRTKKAEHEDRIAELERMVGKLTMENELLKKAKSWLGSRRT